MRVRFHWRKSRQHLRNTLSFWWKLLRNQGKEMEMTHLYFFSYLSYPPSTADKELLKGILEKKNG